MLKFKNNINQKIVYLLFYTFPLSFIIGNLVVSLHLLLFIVISLFFIKEKHLTFRFNTSSWILIAFFLYFFLSTTIQYLNPGLLNEKIQDWSLENNPILKSFLLIRFLILIFVLDTLFFNKILNLKKFFLSALICTSFISTDIILQYTTGFELFGFESHVRWNQGPFGDEHIAGSYLQKFSFFSFFYIFQTFKDKNFNKPLLIFIIVLHASAIMLSGNRMPMILFLFGCGLIILFIKNLRLIMSVSLIVFLTIFLFEKNISNFLTNSSQVKKETSYLLTHFLHIEELDKIEEGKKELNILKLRVFNTPNYLTRNTRDAGHIGIFKTSIIMWKERPFLGYGLKSFRIKCWEIIAKNELLAKPENISCSNHAHNYYLELLSEAGIIGTSLMIIFFLILLKDSFRNIKKYNQKNNFEIGLLISIIITVFLEIWPLKTTGSFFTTWNATFLWLSVGLLLAINTKKSLGDST